MGCTQYQGNEVTSASQVSLFDQLKMGDLTLKNRIIMAPMTRCRGELKTGCANELVAEYYSQRASFGMILTECSQISPRSNAFPGSCGIYSQEQVSAWSKVVDRVHQRGGLIFIQLWHCGRAGASRLNPGMEPLWAPSAIKISTKNNITQEEHEVPKEMTLEDIKVVQQEFKQAALNAKHAGFDGVQLHAANGYLLDQFLRDHTNKRTDAYGGSIPNRCRFLLETLDLVIGVWGSQRVGVRISPTGRFNDMFDSNPADLVTYLAKELDSRNLSHLEIKESAPMEESEKHFSQFPKGSAQIKDISALARPLFRNTLISNQSFDFFKATKHIQCGIANAVSFGTLAISNPDLPLRFKCGLPLNMNTQWDKLFSGGNLGYSDYKYQDNPFVPIKLGNLHLKNRFVMAPMTRGRTENGVASDLVAEYYSQRASFGLIFTECTAISKRGELYAKACSLHNDQHVQGWKTVTQKVHAAGGCIFVQLWHAGRGTDPSLNGNNEIWAPSAVKQAGTNQNTQKEYQVPKEMTKDDIKQLIQEYKKAAELAQKAGFDGIQITAANGSLLDQFLKDGTNKRTDEYGGNTEGRCKILIDILQECSKIYHPGQIGIRLTPTGRYSDMYDSNPKAFCSYLALKLSQLRIGHIEVKESNAYDVNPPGNFQKPSEQIPDCAAYIRPFYNGALICNQSLTLETAKERLREGIADLVSFGTLAIKNPDLVQRFKNNWEVEQGMDMNTAFYGGAEGYTSYPPHKISLFNTFRLTDKIVLKNRFVMAPLTRCRADPKNGIANELIKTYYTQRAGFGLIITESSSVSQLGEGFPGAANIYNDEQAEGWKKVIESVHSKNCFMICQINHCGRATDPQINGGNQPWAPSAIAIKGKNNATQQDYPVPKEMTKEDISTVISQFKAAAVLCKKAGFDGIQLHCANGYLLDQFLRDGSNKRTDEYGGDVSNRVRLLAQVLEAVLQVYDNQCVGIRISPTGRFGDMFDSNPALLVQEIAVLCEKLNIGHVEVKEANVIEGKDSPLPSPTSQIADVAALFRKFYSGIIINNQSFNFDSGTQKVQSGVVDLISFGTLAMSNPDLPQRLEHNKTINSNVDWTTAFFGGEKGYTDYPFA